MIIKNKSIDKAPWQHMNNTTCITETHGVTEGYYCMFRIEEATKSLEEQHNLFEAKTLHVRHHNIMHIQTFTISRTSNA